MSITIVFRILELIVQTLFKILIQIPLKRLNFSLQKLSSRISRKKSQDNKKEEEVVHKPTQQSKLSSEEKGYKLFFIDELLNEARSNNIPVGKMPVNIFNDVRWINIKCPICRKKHRYRAKLETLDVLAAPTPNDDKLVMLEFTRLFKCPNTNQLFECTFQVEWILGLGIFVEDVSIS